MKKNEGLILRFWAFGLIAVIIATTFMITKINSVEMSLVYMGILAGICIVGLATGLWAGLAASVIGVFAVVYIYQYAGIFASEGAFINLATELGLLLVVGPLSGRLSERIDLMHKKSEKYRLMAEERNIHDENFGTIKTDWMNERLEEEIFRAKKYSRPLSIALILLERNQENRTDLKYEYQAVCQALVRIVASTSQPPVTMSFVSNERLLVLLPEFSFERSRELIEAIQTRFASEKYFPTLAKSPQKQRSEIGKPLSLWGTFRSGLACLDGVCETPADLIEKASLSIR